MTSIKDQDLDSVLNNLFGPAPRAPAPNPNNGGWKEIDLSDRFRGMIPQNSMQPLMGPGAAPQVPQVTPKQEPNQPITVYLREGLKSYRKLEIESPVPVAIEMGPIHGVAGQVFEYAGKIKVYLTENMNKPIDLSRIDHSRFITLVIVKAPFLGTMLVPEAAVVRAADQRQQILKG